MLHSDRDDRKYIAETKRSSIGSLADRATSLAALPASLLPNNDNDARVEMVQKVAAIVEEWSTLLRITPLSTGCILWFWEIHILKV